MHLGNQPLTPFCYGHQRNSFAPWDALGQELLRLGMFNGALF